MDSTRGDFNQTDYSNFTQLGLHRPHLQHKLFGKTSSKLGLLAIKQNLLSMRHIGSKSKYEMTVDHKTIGNIQHFDAAQAAISTARPVDEIVRDAEAKLLNIMEPDDDASNMLPETEEEQIQRETTEKLKSVISQSNEVLASATTIFPLTLFRDDLVVDRTKVTITKRNFFFSSEVMSIRVEDILNVKIALGPFFGSITLAVRVLSSEDHHSINYLWRRDAVRLKHLIQGYIIAQHNNIDCKHQTKDDLIATLIELGHDTSR